MMRALLFTLALQVPACGPPPAFTTTHGTAIDLATAAPAFTQGTLSAIEAELVARLAASTGWSASAMTRELRGTTVQVVSLPWKCQGVAGYQDGATCAGEQVEHWARVSNDPPGCPWESTYAHELAHVLQAFVGHASDPGHADPRVWGQVLELERAHDESCPHGAAPVGAP